MLLCRIFSKSPGQCQNVRFLGSPFYSQMRKQTSSPIGTLKKFDSASVNWSLSPSCLKASFVNGTWLRTGCNMNVIDPGKGQVIGNVETATVENLGPVIQTTHEAFLSWKTSIPDERYKVLMKWFQLIEEYQIPLAKLITLENGKPLNEAINEVSYAGSFVRWFAEESLRQYGDVIPSCRTMNQFIQVFREPVGVCSLIVPWNFPAAMITRKVAAALAAGCGVIVKPAEDTPFTALALAVLADIAGLPRGLFNVVLCNRGAVTSFGERLCTDSMVRKISFTGSSEVGEVIMRLASRDTKRVSLELGGNAPLIVFDDADVQLAVDNAVKCKFRGAGQTCISANRLYVHESKFDQIKNELKRRMSEFKIGYGFDEMVNIGPLINQKAIDAMILFVTQAKVDGAEIIMGGKKAFLTPELNNGYYFEPTLLDCRKVHEGSATMSKEIFGPIVLLSDFKDADEVIAKANSTTAGLASYVFTSSLETAKKVSRELEFGMVGVNVAAISSVELPFGGIKASGYGREGSKYGLHEYTYLKSIVLG